MKVFLLLLLIRVGSVFIVNTFFSPDEYFQSQEIAHKTVFGYGHETWEWSKGIRSYFYPMLIAGLYKILALLKLDTVTLVVLVPRIMQAILSAYSDYRFYIWSKKSKWSLFIVITSWFWFYTASRTLVNTLESSVTTIALSFFPWKETAENTLFLWLVSFLCFIRPTSALTWIPLCFYHIKKSKHSVWELLLKRYLLIGVVVGGALVALDSYFHGSLIITPWEFLKVNVFDEIGSFYGTHPWYWYFSSGLPAILGIGIIPFCLSVFAAIKSWDELKNRQILLISIIITIFTYSLLPHKEFRFLLQILPLCLYCIAQFLSEWSRQKSAPVIWLVAIVIFFANAVPAGYMGVVHQQGTMSVMPKLAQIASEYRSDNGQQAKIFFMMPCHSTPYYSHIHTNISMRFLTCEPNFKKVENYLDEADLFYQEPMKWIRSHLPVHPVSALPTHVVVFDTLTAKIGDFLSIYKPLEIFFHSDYTLSNRSGKNVIIYERINTVPKATTKAPAQKIKAEPIVEELQDEL
ncbi:unnamed protein product [Diamesa hyperborea]